ncbi:uracil-DNA glycosylase [Zhengella mangrovi]|uniref:Uracil-DNA glycosylase n=1 Tax=Zhengella mangrovi TaxID=1982044 RepID=A0A2G1QHD1_9HYPH|nr:uracil-DNA glycosylase family protein [Zhengella mangrovi]PHP64933.1 uracil-DNA glycosylase [Zhengella mangrovi]
MADRRPDSPADVAARIRACRICLERPAGRPLPHEPRPVVVESATARLLIAGQAPGTRVHASGIPFNDPSGDRLRDWMGIGRDTFYDPARVAIAPMGFCFPGLDAKGGDLPPRKECAPAWRSALIGSMDQVDLVLAIGLYAQKWHLGDLRKATLTETVADWQRILDATRNRPGGPAVLAMPHPSWRNTAWLKRNPWFERDLLPVLRSEVRRLVIG